MTTDERLTAIENKVDKIEQDLSKYKGFIGGILFVFSSVFTVLGLAISYFKH